MNFEQEEFIFVSSNNTNKVYGKILKPSNAVIKGIIQISHGMCEYFDKYDNFIKFLLENNFAVCGHDHIGHGNSISSEHDKGYFAKKDGYKVLIDDTKTVSDIVKERIKNDVPLYLFGHSMGSLISRCYSAKYGDNLNGLILCGTVGPQPLANAGIKLAKMIAISKGDHYRSKKLYDLALDFANINFFPVQTRFDWICSDEDVVKKHVEDKKCDFLFTVSGFSDLFHLVNLSNSAMVIKTIPKDLPIFFISGELDPIGENGAGVKKAVKLYENAGIKNIKCKIYPEDRHELINEKNKKEVYMDVINWISSINYNR